MPLFTAASEEPTATIIRGLVNAINAKNKDAAMAFLGDDPEVYQRDAYYRGRDKVAIWLREDIDNYRDHFEIVEMRTDNSRVIGLVRVISAGSGGYYKASDYLYTFQAVVEGSKIQCLNVGQSRPGLC